MDTPPASRAMPTAEVSIRSMQAEDLPAVADIVRRSFPSPWSEQALAAELEKPFAHLWVAEKPGAPPQVVGIVILWAIAGTGYIPLIAVHPDHRRHGIGRRLMETAIATARRFYMHQVVLEVRASNHAAQTLYRTLGFQVVDRIPRHYTDTGEDGLRMVLTLRPQGGTR